MKFDLRLWWQELRQCLRQRGQPSEPPPPPTLTLTPEQNEELLALARSCRRGRGSFVLAFARCNVVPLQEQLVAMLRDALAPTGVTIHEVELTVETVDLPATLAAAPGDGDPLFVYGWASILPSGSPERTLAQLNERRGLYQKLGRPLVFWLPEYALQLIARGAPDFWAWRSGVYEFTLPEAGREALLEREVRQVGWVAQWNLDRAAAEARLHLLRGLLEEYTGAARAETLCKLADLEGTLVGYKAAEGHLREALHIYEGLGDRRSVAVTQHALAELYRLRGEYEEAEHLYRESLQTNEELGDRRSVAVTQHDLADLYRLRGEYEEAEHLYRESLQTSEELGDRRTVAVTLHNLALMRRDQGRTDEALELLARSRDTFAVLGLDKDVAEEEELIAEISERGFQDSNG